MASSWLVIFLIEITVYVVPVATSPLALDSILLHHLVQEFLWGWSQKDLIL